MQFDAIGATQEFACGLQPNQAIRCWGAGNATRVGPYTGMATGRLHVCGQKADRIECWSYLPGVAGLTITGEFDGIAMGDNDLVCGIRTVERSVECYDISASAGGWSGPWIQSPYGVDFGQVSAGGAVCGLRSDSRAQCFSGLSAAPPTFNDFQEIATGANFACAIRSTGAVVCWGDNSDGQLNVPSGTYVELTAFGEGICGVKTNGTVTCWGRSVFGNLSPPAGVVLRLNSDDE